MVVAAANMARRLLARRASEQSRLSVRVGQTLPLCYVCDASVMPRHPAIPYTATLPKSAVSSANSTPPTRNPTSVPFIRTY